MTVAIDMNEYLVATRFVDSDHDATIEKSKGLTANVHSTKEKAVRLFYFVKDEIRYNVYAERAADAHFKASYVLTNEEGIVFKKPCSLWPWPGPLLSLHT
ncbi:MAG TPA: hypothetical protein DCR97_12060 [Deltaproteobacteria bacterium]|nr:hypothetical protein [Deltaproteobacteria bacterium]